MNITRRYLQRESGCGHIQDCMIALKRLKCFSNDEYCGIIPNLEQRDFNPEPPVFACEFSSVPGHEHLLALGNEDGKIAIQDITVPSNRKQIEGYQAHSNAIFDLAWIPGEFKLATASGDTNATLWDVKNGNTFVAVMHFRAHTKSVKTVAVCPDNKDLIATGSRDGIIMLWDTRLDHGINQLRPDNSISNAHTPSAAPFSRNKRSRNGFVPSDAGSITSVVIQDDRHLISCGAGDGSIKVWDLRKSYSTYRRDPQPTHRLCKSKHGGGQGYTCLLLDSGRVRLYASCTDSSIYAFNVATYEEFPVTYFTGHQTSSYYVKSCLSPDDRYLLSGSSDLKAYLWDTTSYMHHPAICLDGNGGEVTAVAWCPVGDTRLLTCSDDGWHRLWKVSDVRDDAARNLACGPIGEARSLGMEMTACDKLEAPSTPATPAAPATPATPASPATPATPRSILQLTPHSDGGWRRAVEKTPDGACPSVRGCRNCRGDPSIPCTQCKVPTHSGTSKKRLEVLYEVNEDLLSPKECQECKRELFLRSSEVQEPTASQRGRETRRLFSPGKTYSDLLGITPIGDSASDMMAYRLPPVLVCTHQRTSVLSSPTLNLPNYVLDGTSPHHTCSRESRHLKENVDWLTKLRKERGSVEKKKHSAPSPVTPSSSTNSRSDRKRPRRRESSVEPGTSKSGQEHSANRVRSATSIVKFFRTEEKSEGRSSISS